MRMTHLSQPGRILFTMSLVTALGVGAGCPKSKDATPEDVSAKTPSKDTPAKSAAATPKPGAPAANPNASHPDCVGPMTDVPAEEIQFGERIFTRKGSVLSLDAADPDDQFVLGHITDAKDYTPENQANIEVVLKWMTNVEKVDAIAVTGDLGESASSIEAMVNAIAASNVPVFVIAGNRECRADFKAGLAASAAKHKNVINMNQIRVVNADDVSLVSLPGYFNNDYIHCAEGCEYFPADVEALDDIAKRTTAPVRVLLSHGPPKMKGPTGLDRIHEDVNVGDPALAKYLAKGDFPFGLFGNIQEAGGYASDLSGEKRIPVDAYADSLYLNSGPIDSVRWAMLDDTESLGMAGVLRIKGKQASHRIYRIKPGEAKVKR